MLAHTASAGLPGGDESVVSAGGQARDVHCSGVWSTPLQGGLQGAHGLPERYVNVLCGCMFLRTVESIACISFSTGQVKNFCFAPAVGAL